MPDIAVRVNGTEFSLNVDSRMSLLDLLRERLGLTGSKKGCDHGQCGACTVLIDGRRANACLALAVAQDGADVTTVEGLADGGDLHPLQAAFIERDAFQCGYCTPGQLCSAAGPDSGLPFSSRNLVACLREGARRFGWERRDPRPGTRRDGRWLTGTGVAASTYPARRQPSQATASAQDGGFVVRIAAADIGTGARTALTQIAAQALETSADRVRVEVGDSALPRASLAGGSMGTTSWGSAVVKACEALRKDGSEGTADTADDVKADSRLARHAFGTQFAEVQVDVDTGEVRLPRLLGVFAVGRVIDETLARSQFIGGMTMGLGMALMEETVVDEGSGDFLNHDLAQYHIAACADVRDIDAAWIDEVDPHLNPMGAKGIGEIGIVGTAAAVANAVYHATGQRIRDLPVTPAKLVRPAR